MTTTVKLEDYSFWRDEEEELIFILKQQVSVLYFIIVLFTLQAPQPMWLIED